MLDQQQAVVATMSNQIRNSGKLNNDISAMIGKLNNSETMKIVQSSAKSADEVLQNVKEISKETSEFRADVESLKSRLEALDPEWDSKFGLAEENVAKSLINIREANNTWNIHEPILEKQNEKFAKWNDSFSSKLQELRDKISLAKHLARGVSSLNLKFIMIFMVCFTYK
jgi:laminin, alpha 1/2